MALILPPGVPAIVESATAQSFFADSIFLKVRRDTVLLQFATRRCLWAGRPEYVVNAAAIFTPWAFADGLAEVNLQAMKAGMTVSGRAKLVVN